MAIWNLGSINADLFYAVPHLPQPGETLAALTHHRGLGGKGTNISVAAARAAARVFHIGAVGEDGAWSVERLLEYGVDVSHIALSESPTGHAIISTDADGENQIMIWPGANAGIELDKLKQALASANAGDWFVCQNETTLQKEGVRLAAELGQKVAYVAAPFDVKAVQDVLAYLDLLILNEIEAAQFTEATGKDVRDLSVPDVIITLGARGCVWYHNTEEKAFDPVPVSPKDTTGAGDTFAGYVLACLDRGQPMAQAIKTATLAAAIMVTRQGTADVIPDLKDLEDFRLSGG